MSNSFYLAACLLGFIWLIGLWKSVQRAFPDPKGGHLDISRRVLFHLASLLATVGPVNTLLNGFTLLSMKIWAYTYIASYGLFFFWYLRAYRYSDFLFEASEFGFSGGRRPKVHDHSKLDLHQPRPVHRRPLHDIDRIHALSDLLASLIPVGVALRDHVSVFCLAIQLAGHRQSLGHPPGMPQWLLYRQKARDTADGYPVCYDQQNGHAGAATRQYRRDRYRTDNIQTCDERC